MGQPEESPPKRKDCNGGFITDTASTRAASNHKPPPFISAASGAMSGSLISACVQVGYVCGTAGRTPI